MSKIDFHSSFYNSISSRDELINNLKTISGTENKTISAIPFGSELSVPEIFENNTHGNRYVEKINEGEGVILYKLFHDIKYKGEEKEREGLFFIYDHPSYENVHIAFCIEDSKFFHHELRPFLAKLYPDIVFAFIKHHKLKKLIENFKLNNYISEIRIARASQKLRFENDRIMSAVTWPKMSIDEAFTWVYENNGWFNSLQFDVISSQNNTLAKIFITRQGVIRTDRYFGKVLESFIQPVCKLLDENFQFFSHRSRCETEDLSVKPLVIEYEEQLFEDVNQNQRFIQSIEKMDSASVSVLHGNPYIHLSLIDYYDGSVFDLWVLKSNQIVIVPQMKGTVASIKRVINHIFDSFAEGEVKNYEHTVA